MQQSLNTMDGLVYTLADLVTHDNKSVNHVLTIPN